MAKPTGTPTVVTAQLTASGAPVYLDGSGGWTPELARARVFEDAVSTEPAIAEQQPREQAVVGVTAIPVAVDGDVPRPLSARERIRAAGPTVAIRRPDGPPESRQQPHG